MPGPSQGNPGITITKNIRDSQALCRLGRGEQFCPRRYTQLVGQFLLVGEHQPTEERKLLGLQEVFETGKLAGSISTHRLIAMAIEFEAETIGQRRFDDVADERDRILADMGSTYQENGSVTEGKTIHIRTIRMVKEGGDSQDPVSREEQ